MAWSFGDSFDLYAAAADATSSYWDVSTATGVSIVAGRFAGSQAFRWTAAANSILIKSSGVNDAVHHLVVAFQQTAAISGTNLGLYLELFDGVTAQCTIVFRSDGAIILASGGPAGTALATYTGAVPLANTWYAFEFEIKIDNAAGSFIVRKNGNTVADFTATSLDTQISANAYANKLQIAMSLPVSQQIDDLFWRSDASSVAWLGDIRCYARMPASDASVTFSRSPSGAYLLSQPTGNIGLVTNQGRYVPFTIGNNGSIGTVTLSITTASTANIKCSIFSDNAGAPGTALGSATPIAAPGIGTATFTFGTPVTVTAGAKYWVGVICDASSGNYGGTSLNLTGVSSASPVYASFPANNPTVTTGLATPVIGIGVTPAVSWPLVGEAQQDSLTSYVFDANPGDADFYGIASIASTPATVIATTIRAYMQKSDAGTRTAAVQLKSGATTVASPTLVLTTSGWLWAWRTDLTDPNTGAAWTPAAVNNAQIGPKTIA